ncbi:MAG: Nif3-like dinuclear metal center hexameric protein [Alkalispirochaetaceae bacterium]
MHAVRPAGNVEPPGEYPRGVAAAEGGVNDHLVAALDAAEVIPLKPHRPDRLKLVVFVPEADLAGVRSALARAGAGTIGHYHECSFSVAGEGTFRGDETTRPAIGAPERFERVDERRLEMELPRRVLPAVLAALDDAHPYEEVAYDLYPLETVGSGRTGAGRAVLLREPMSPEAVADRLKAHLKLDWVELSQPADARPVRWVGVCPGAGGSLLGERPVDLFFTGEMRHHDILDLEQRGRLVVLPGHTQTERPYLPTYRERLVRNGGEAIDWRISEADVPNPRM